MRIVIRVVLALAVSLRRLGAERPFLVRGMAVVVAAYWLSLVARWPAATIDPRDSLGKDRLLAFVRSSGLDHRSVQLHVSWGTYYIAHLFGDSYAAAAVGLLSDAVGSLQIALLIVSPVLLLVAALLAMRALGSIRADMANMDRDWATRGAAHAVHEQTPEEWPNYRIKLKTRSMRRAC